MAPEPPDPEVPETEGEIAPSGTQPSIQGIVVPAVPAPIEAAAVGVVEAEGAAFDAERRIELARKRQVLRHERHDQRQRVRYARRLFKLVVGWFVGIAVVLLLQGFHRLPYPPHVKFRLADSVVLALISSTTVNVIGVFVIVVNYLFPRRTGT